MAKAKASSPEKAVEKRRGSRIPKVLDNQAGREFREMQADMLASQTNVGQRAPGRARIDQIIATTIELLDLHNRDDITIAMIASKAGITRTSIYAHFSNIGEIFEQISIRFIQQSGIFVEEYVRQRNPVSLQQVIILTIEAIQCHFNRPEGEGPNAEAAHIPFEARQVIPEFDKVSALTYHSLWETGWPVEPLSEEDPFRMLVILQSAIFEASIKRHGEIIDAMAEDAKLVALDFIERTERRFSRNKLPVPDNPVPERTIIDLFSRIAQAKDPRLLGVAVSQLQALAQLNSETS